MNDELRFKMRDALREELPDPESLIPEIEKSLEFISSKPDMGSADIPEELLALWSISDDRLPCIVDELESIARKDLHHSVVPSLIIFAHIYLHHYNSGDFADFSNFIYLFCRFQTLLKSVREMRRQACAAQENLSRILLFDLENLDDLPGKSGE